MTWWGSKGGGCVGISTGYKHMEGYNVVVSVCSWIELYKIYFLKKHSVTMCNKFPCFVNNVGWLGQNVKVTFCSFTYEYTSFISTFCVIIFFILSSSLMLCFLQNISRYQRRICVLTYCKYRDIIPIYGMP